MSRLDDLATRKALLVARTDLERIDLAVAVRDLADAFEPHPEAGRLGRMHPMVARAIRLAIPLFGASRLGLLARALSVGLVAFRIIGGLRSR
ncbi:MAG: hypothetical protein KGL70_05125 [Betaproteobacteria bacterium]|nr:hypothetical protein [Betaproteobacteria bacterium]MDE2209998.1 hypothetical protein [Betaproteobacteria bacterium]MDE2358749.1 hypothetical protein [Betaproteobacteria bacterium]